MNPQNASRNASMYFAMLELENIRSVGESQRLNLLDESGVPIQWTVILGDNGVGKTTLLQCLVRMCPRFNPPSDNGDHSSTNQIEPELNQEEENDVLAGLVRSGTSDAKICARMLKGATLGKSTANDCKAIETKIQITLSGENIENVTSSGTIDGENEYDGGIEEPLVLAYGADRRVGIGNLDRWRETSPTVSLFDSGADLLDVEELLTKLDHLQRKNPESANKLLKSLKALLVDMLPALNGPEDIDIRGPSVTSRSEKKNSGVWVRTSSGEVPFVRLSLGYQTVFAWTVDIAWRMIDHYSDCENPLLEPAIVIVDEIDLHLHPNWQREIRQHLIYHFPAVQFIATAHSPLMVQDALDANIVVVRHRGDIAVIENEPTVVQSWRLDQILTSELYGFDTARPFWLEPQIKRRVELAEKGNLTNDEQAELDKLDRLVAKWPTAESQEDQKAMEIIRQAAEKLSENNSIL